MCSVDNSEGSSDSLYSVKSHSVCGAWATGMIYHKYSGPYDVRLALLYAVMKWYLVKVQSHIGMRNPNYYRYYKYTQHIIYC